MAKRVVEHEGAKMVSKVHGFVRKPGNDALVLGYHRSALVF
jgi:hypothetical protein